MKNNIKISRKELNITQEELANKLSISRKSLNDIENGKIVPRLDIAYKIAVELDNTIDNIFVDEEYNNKGHISLNIKEQDEFINNFNRTYIGVKYDK